MNLPQQLAKHFREVYFGGNWTWSNLKEQLANVSWQQATAKVGTLNTILVLACHIHYYVLVQTKVMQGGLLEGHDKDSFATLSISDEQEWQVLLEKMWADAEIYAALVAQLPETQLNDFFVQEKYGTWHRNLLGLIEHTHYHLGQIAIMKKLLT